MTRSSNTSSSFLLADSNTSVPSTMAVIKDEPSEAIQQPLAFRAASQPISVATTAPNTPQHNSATSSDSMSTGATLTHDGDVNMENATNADNAAKLDDALTSLGGQSRQLIKAIQKIDALNIDSTLPPLPKIVVVGDQSAGKSSVIEALCDIQLPRAGGTCTRCPFLITTTTAADDRPWSCRVTLHLKYHYVPGLKGGQKQFEGWSEQPLAILEFCTIQKKKDLETVLRRAQLAILNPHLDHRGFASLGAKVPDQTKVGFSPNIVSLEICGHNLPELSLYDLPGAINSTGRLDEHHLVKFVEKLVKSYADDEQSIILLACAVNQDLHTGTAYRFLTECTKSKALSRCLGVLTKPDLWINEISSSRVDSIKQTLAGEVFVVGYGWFVTRQLSQAELDREVQYAAARQLEAEFFSSHPWSTDLAAYQDRFGIPRLQNELSMKLTSEIVNILPEVQERVNNRILQLNSELAMFPAPVVAPSIAVVIEVDKVKMAIQEELNADADQHKMMEKFRKQYRTAITEFSKHVKAIKPCVELSTPGYIKPAISIDSEDELDIDEDTPSRKRRRGQDRAASSTPSHGFSLAKTPTTGDRPRRAPASTRRTGNSDSITFHLDDIQQRYDDAPGADVGGAADQSVNRKLMQESLNGCGLAIEDVLKQIRHIFDTTINNIIWRVLAHRQTTELARQITRLARELGDELYIETLNAIHRVCECESHRPITYSKDDLSAKREKYEQELRNLRAECRVTEYFETLEGQGYNVPKTTEWKKKAADPSWILTNLGNDPYDREVGNLPWPLAYYDIASAQLVDAVAKQLELGLLHRYHERIHRKLLEGLHTDDTQYCASLLAEDPIREQERLRLIAEQGRLQQALEELKGLPSAFA